VAETSYRPFGRKGRVLRLIVRRVKPTPGSQLALFTAYDYHPFITDRQGATRSLTPTIGATPRSRTSSATSSTASACTICLQGSSPPTPPGSPWAS
jgi:hypothetical protein